MQSMSSTVAVILYCAQDCARVPDPLLAIGRFILRISAMNVFNPSGTCSEFLQCQSCARAHACIFVLLCMLTRAGKPLSASENRLFGKHDCFIELWLASGHTSPLIMPAHHSGYRPKDLLSLRS
jgi:hypothetical protein